MSIEIVRRRAGRRNPGQALVTAAYIAVSAYMVAKAVQWIWLATVIAGTEIMEAARPALAFLTG